MSISMSIRESACVCVLSVGKRYTVRTVAGWRFGVCGPYARGTWSRGRRARSASVGRGIPWRPSKIPRVRVTQRRPNEVP